MANCADFQVDICTAEQTVKVIDNVWLTFARNKVEVVDQYEGCVISRGTNGAVKCCLIVAESSFEFVELAILEFCLPRMMRRRPSMKRHVSRP